MDMELTWNTESAAAAGRPAVGRILVLCAVCTTIWPDTMILRSVSDAHLLIITHRRWKALSDAERHRFERRVGLLERSASAPVPMPASAPSFEYHHQANRLEHPQLPHATRAHATVFWFGYNSSVEEASRAPKPSAAVAVPMSTPAPALSRTAAPVSSVNLTPPVATPPEPPTKGWLRPPEPPHEQPLACSGPAVKLELAPPNPTAPLPLPPPHPLGAPHHVCAPHPFGELSSNYRLVWPGSGA